MQLNLDSGRIEQASWLPSPNFDARPHGHFINTLVIHAISLPPEQFGGCFVEDFFCNRLDRSAHPYFETIGELKVSSHFYIRRSGELIQFVATRDRAWHAGVSEFQGLGAVNDFYMAYSRKSYCRINRFLCLIGRHTGTESPCQNVPGIIIHYRRQVVPAPANHL